MSASSTARAAEYFALGLPEVFSISAAYGTGTGDLLDAIISHFPRAEPEPIDEADREEAPTVGDVAVEGDRVSLFARRVFVTGTHG